VEGFVIASAKSPEFDKGVAAAMASFALSAAKRTKSELGLWNLSDVLIRCSGGKVFFKVVDVSPEESFILSALIPPLVRYYKRGINIAASGIKDYSNKNTFKIDKFVNYNSGPALKTLQPHFDFLNAKWERF
jgi:hypothetical protein